MKIIFMGTPDFAVPALEMLNRSKHEVVLVVTNPDRPGKRGKEPLPSPVKKKALSLGLPVVQPEKIKDNENFFNQVTDASPDLIIVAAYGKLLPLELLAIPRLGAINIHASLLPKYRGAAPIHRVIESGDVKTGVTLMYMAEGLDEGDIIAVSKTETGNKTTGQLHDELATMGSELLEHCLDDIESGSIKRTPQNNANATYAAKVEKGDGHVDFSKDGKTIERLIRAMTPFPGAYAMLENDKMKIISAVLNEKAGDGIPGEIIGVNDNGIEVKAGNNSSIIIKEMQMPGRKAMSASSFLRGNSLAKGQRLR